MLVPFGEPAVGEDSCGILFRLTAADVDLVAGAAAFARLLTEIDTAVVLTVLVDHEIELQLEVHELFLRQQ